MNGNQPMRLLVTLAVCLLANAACSQRAPNSPQVATGLHSLPFSVVSSGDSAADISAAETFGWARSGAARQPAPAGMQAETLVQDAIVSTLQQKGYRQVATAGEADLLVDYHIALGDAAAGSALAGTYGVQPSINVDSPDPEKYEKGTLVIEVIDSRTGLSAWRSALQGFAGMDLPAAQRRERIELMMQRMLSGVPAR